MRCIDGTVQLRCIEGAVDVRFFSSPLVHAVHQLLQPAVDGEEQDGRAAAEGDEDEEEVVQVIDGEAEEGGVFHHNRRCSFTCARRN